MKLAIIGSRSIQKGLNLADIMPEDVEEIVTGGAKGVDAFAAQYAYVNQIPLKVFLPEYEKYGRRAPLMRNYQIVDYADAVLAVWDGVSKGTMHTYNYARKQGKITAIFKAVWPEEKSDK